MLYGFAKPFLKSEKDAEIDKMTGDIPSPIHPALSWSGYNGLCWLQGHWLQGILEGAGHLQLSISSAAPLPLWQGRDEQISNICAVSDLNPVFHFSLCLSFSLPLFLHLCVVVLPVALHAGGKA